MICPHCVHNLAAEEPLRAGMFSYSPLDGMHVEDERIPAEPGAHRMIGAVMAAAGKVISVEALANRQSDDIIAGQMVRSYTHRLRRAFAACDVEAPFERIHGVGLRWTGPKVERVAA